MTVLADDTVERFTVTGVGPYPFSFRIFADTDLQVTACSTATPSVPTLLTYLTHYTVAGANDADGGTVTLTAPAAATYAAYTLDIRSNTSIDQPTSIRNQGRFLPEVHEDAFDRLGRQVQDQERRLKSCVRFPDNVLNDGMMTPIAAWVSRYLAISAAGVLEPAVMGSTAVTPSIINSLMSSSTSEQDVLLSLLMNRSDTAPALASLARTSAEIAAGVTPVNYAYPPDPYDIRRLGVVGDGTTDDTAALQAAANFCEASGVPIRGFTGTCKVTSTINLRCTGDLSMLTVSANSSSVDPVIRVGTTSGAPTQINGLLRLPRVVNSAKAATGWTSMGTGIDLGNVYQSQLHIPYVYGFLVGIHAGGYGGEGFSYNTVLMELVSTNKIGLRVEGNATNSWANQNTFIGGRFFIPTAEGSAISGSRHIQLVPHDITVDDVSWPNTNTFIGPSIEGDSPEYLLSLSGNNNTFINARFESATPVILMLGHASVLKTYENQIIGGYGSRTMTVTTSGVVAYNGIINPRGTSLGGDGTCLNLRNEGSSSDPLIQGFGASASGFFNATNAATNWSVRLASTKLQGKQAADTNPRIEIDFANGIIKFLNSLTLQVGAGTPEGSVTAPVGSLYMRTNGGAATSLYVKETGSGNTGWTAK